MSDIDAKPSTSLTPLPKIPVGEPPEQLSSLMRDYPGLLIGGGLALGLLAGVLMPKRAGGKLAQRVVGLAAVAGELGLALSRNATAMQHGASRFAGTTRAAQAGGMKLAQEATRIIARGKR